jgi:hypothetical protein
MAAFACELKTFHRHGRLLDFDVHVSLQEK